MNHAKITHSAGAAPPAIDDIHHSLFTIHFSRCKFAGMTLAASRRYLTEELLSIYETGESASIAGLVIEHITGKKRRAQSENQQELTEEQLEKIRGFTSRLLRYEPIQYILNEAWFSGLKFYVDKNVLIPRSETEELLEWIIDNCKFPVAELRILDIGTGSGCIPVALKRRIRKAEVWSCDISAGAIGVAKQNAATLGAEVNFIQLDFLDPEARKKLPLFDIIVSNPPYIPEKDMKTIKPNVLDYEPETALFVTGNDSLIFYSSIAQFGKEHLKKNGSIYLEIHEDYGQEVIHLFNSQGYNAELKKDMQRKDRMVKIIQSS